MIIKEQTSIEWLINMLETEIKDYEWSNFNTHFEQAKEMHKQEIIQAFEEGWDYNEAGFVRWISENYYNETFKSESNEN